jgi:ADP-ribose pyrophosphatase YjhB (NUDIX family)
LKEKKKTERRLTQEEAEAQEERETAPEMGAAGLIKNQQNGEFFLVENEGRWSIPVGHKKKADDTLKDTFFREMKEEIKLDANGITWLESLGTVFVQKDENSPKKWFEVIYIKVETETAQKLKYSEKGKELSTWLKRSKTEALSNLDVLAKKAFALYREKYVSSKFIVGGGYDKNRVLSGGEHCQF